MTGAAPETEAVMRRIVDEMRCKGDMIVGYDDVERNKERV